MEMKTIVVPAGKTVRLKGALYENVNFVGEGGSLYFSPQSYGFVLRNCKFSGHLKRISSGFVARCYSTDFSGATVENWGLCGMSGTEYSTGSRLPKLYMPLTPCGKYLIGYKKLASNVVVELHIPKDAPIVYGLSDQKEYKLRTPKAKVARVVSGKPFNTNHMPSLHRGAFYYELGKWATAHNWDPDPLKSCLGGIHFFHTLKLAKEY